MTDCPCQTVDPRDDDLAALSGEPDFTIESAAKTHHVYWRSQDHVASKFGKNFVYAYASVGGSYIVLNEGLAEVIDHQVLAHEIGHNLGYHHVDGTLMDPYKSGIEDGQGRGPLTDVSRDVFEQIENVRVCDWTRRPIRDLGLVGRYYSSGHSRIDTLAYAGSRYARGLGADAFYLSDFERLGGHEGVREANLQKGEFYG